MESRTNLKYKKNFKCINFFFFFGTMKSLLYDLLNNDGDFDLIIDDGHKQEVVNMHKLVLQVTSPFFQRNLKGNNFFYFVWKIPAQLHTEAKSILHYMYTRDIQPLLAHNVTHVLDMLLFLEMSLLYEKLKFLSTATSPNFSFFNKNMGACDTKKEVLYSPKVSKFDNVFNSILSSYISPTTITPADVEVEVKPQVSISTVIKHKVAKTRKRLMELRSMTNYRLRSKARMLRKPTYTKRCNVYA